MTPREQKLLDTTYTPSVISKLKREWSSQELASALDMRVRDIENIGDMTFLELGAICREFSLNDKLWSELGYVSFPAWMNSGSVRGSRSKRYAAITAINAMLEIDVPIEEAVKLPRGSLQALSAIPKQQRAEYVKIAPELEVNQLRDKIEKECPDAQLEGLSQMRFRMERSARKTVEAAIDAIQLVNPEIKTREQALEFLAIDWLTSHQTEIESVGCV